MVLAGRPGAGKTLFIKNVILRSFPRFERVYVMHADPLATEYDDIDAEVITELPPNEYWLGYKGENDENEDLGPEDRPRTLCILDDVCFSAMSKSQSARLDRLCGFISTHCNVSVAFLNQDCFAINNIIRKCANIWVLWRPSDTDELKTIARRIGYKSKEIETIFDQHCPSETDSLLIDKTMGTPYPIRVNAYKILNR